MAASALHHAVTALVGAGAALVALVDGGSGRDAHAPALVVGERRAGAAAAAGVLIEPAVGTRAAHQGVARDDDALHRPVVVDVGELVGRALQVDGVLDDDRRRVRVDPVQLVLPLEQRRRRLAPSAPRAAGAAPVQRHRRRRRARRRHVQERRRRDPPDGHAVEQRADPRPTRRPAAAAAAAAAADRPPSPPLGGGALSVEGGQQARTRQVGGRLPRVVHTAPALPLDPVHLHPLQQTGGTRGGSARLTRQ